MKQMQKYPWYDLFHGNIRDPGQFIFFYILLTTVLLGLLPAVMLLTKPHTADDLTYKTFSPDHFEQREEELILYEQDNPLYYRILDFNGMVPSPHKLLNACKSGKVFCIGFTEIKTAATPYCRVESIISTDGISYLTLRDTNNYLYSGMRVFYVMYAVILLCWFLTVCLSVCIGRNPQKYSRKIVHLFFKEGHIRN